MNRRLYICFVLCGCFAFCSLQSQYQLSICSIFKNEARYLKEWIEFHKLQGVEHFFLYNNCSTDPFMEVLDPYIKLGEVTLCDWNQTYEATNITEYSKAPWVIIQTNAFKHCLKRHGKTSKWIAFIDADEFLFCPDGVSLVDFLKNYENYGGLCVNWLLFGTSNIEKLAPSSLLIEHLTRCAPKNEPRNHRVKSIVQPPRIKDCKSAHTFLYKKGFFSVDVHKNRIQDGSANSETVSIDKIRINHYWTRTESEFREDKIPSRTGRRSFETEKFLRDLAKNYNSCVDTAILQFLPALKQKMGAE